jgi:hypothetical protein
MMLKTRSCEERAKEYEKSNPRDILPFSREAAKSVMAKQVKMK